MGSAILTPTWGLVPAQADHKCAIKHLWATGRCSASAWMCAGLAIPLPGPKGKASLARKWVGLAFYPSFGHLEMSTHLEPGAATGKARNHYPKGKCVPMRVACGERIRTSHVICIFGCGVTCIINSIASICSALSIPMCAY